MRRVGGHDGLTTGEVDVDPTGVILGGIFQAEFAADLLDARLDLLDVAGGVVALADDAGDRSALLHSALSRDSIGKSRRTHEGGSGHATWHT